MIRRATISFGSLSEDFSAEMQKSKELCDWSFGETKAFTDVAQTRAKTRRTEAKMDLDMLIVWIVILFVNIVV